jgi:hypothetical protein
MPEMWHGFAVVPRMEHLPECLSWLSFSQHALMHEEEKWAWAENACRMTGKGAVSEGA